MPSSSSDELRVVLTPGYLNFFHPGDRWPGPIYEIVLHRSTDLANTWKDSTVLSTIDGEESRLPNVASWEDASGRTTLGVVWRDGKYGVCGLISASVISRFSHDNGKTWEPEQLLTEEPCGFRGGLAVRGRIRSAAWFQEGPPSQPSRIQARVSYTAGVTWGYVSEVTPLSYKALYPSIAISDSAVHVAWHELIDDKWNIYYRRGKLIRPPVIEREIQYHAGWNLVSLPVLPDSVYQLPSLYAYENGYVQRDEMEAGVGYWSKFDETGETVHYIGEQMLKYNVYVKKRWNLIGGLSVPLAASDVQSNPPGLVVSPFYGYDTSGYFTADTLYPGRAYWVKVSEDATLVLSSQTENISATNRVRIVAFGELPPPPPEEADIRHRTSNIPNQFALEQNYPNPFNPATTIRFRLQVSGFTSLKVYDMFGREVAVLVNETLPAGDHEVEWDAEGVASGVYFYKLVAGNFIDMKKAIVIK